MIEEKVKDILKKYRNLEQKKDWKNQKLLGNDLKFSARDLINVYVELEKEFDIHFKEKDIVAGKFDTFDDIIKLINKEIAYKTRGKEHPASDVRQGLFQAQTVFCPHHPRQGTGMD